MKTIKKSLFAFVLAVFWLANFSMFNLVSAQNDVYDHVLSSTTDKRSLKSAIKWDVLEWKWSELFNEQVLTLMDYVIDFFIVIWIAVAFFGGYKIMTSDKEEALKEWISLVAFGIIWIIIMISARFIASSLVWDNGIITSEFAQTDGGHVPNWIQFADSLYKNIMYPFIKTALYLVIWILFFVMVGKVIGFVTATDDSAKKKAWWIIIRCVVWILIIMWSKQIVEAVMWKEEDVLKIVNPLSWETTPARIDEQWNAILEFGSIPLVAQIINWVMWLTMFAILVLIIIQGYQIFTKPDDPKVRENLKKAILYIVIWVLVIGAAYVIANLLVFNRIPETLTWNA